MTAPSSPCSATIEEMRRARLALPPEGGARHAQIGAWTLESPLRELEDNPRFTKLFPSADAHERHAILLDVQTLLVRCGYHWHLADDDRAWRNRRAIRRRAAARRTAARSGRRRGAFNFGTRQLGLGLAMIWWENTGRPPSRYAGIRSYVEFVDVIAGAAPPQSRRTPPGASPSIDYLVRKSIEDFKLAQAAKDEYRRRGLLDERTWLDREGSAQA